MSNDDRTKPRADRQNERWIGLLLDVALVANEAEAMDEALAAVISRVCEHNGWYAGYSHVAERARELWWSEPNEPHPPEENREELVLFARSWASRVMASGRTECVDDFSDVEEELEMPLADSRPSGGVAATPLLIGRSAVGAMVFFSHSRLSDGIGRNSLSDLIEIVDSIGTQMGRVVERWHLARRIAAETERDRQELGRQIHDGIAQQLVGVKLLAQNLHKRVQAVTPKFGKDWDLLLDSLGQAQSEARAVGRGLAGGIAYSGPDSLIEQLEDLCQVAETGHGVRCSLDVHGEIAFEDELTGAHLLQIAREAVMNALRHASPNRVDIELQTTGEKLVLEVRDDGCGLPTEPNLSAGLGLVGMRYRAAAIGGRIEIESQPDSGTVVRCLV